jgi:hypothetical protein
MRRWLHIVLLGCLLLGGTHPAQGQLAPRPLPPRPPPPRKIKPLKPCTFNEVPKHACAARPPPPRRLELPGKPSPFGYLDALQAKLRRGCVSIHAVEEAVLSRKTAILTCFHAGAPRTSVRVRTTWRRDGYSNTVRPESVTFDPRPTKTKGCIQRRNAARNEPTGASAVALKACLKKALTDARIQHWGAVKPGATYPAVVDFRLAHTIPVRGAVMAMPRKKRPRPPSKRRTRRGR